MVDMSVKIGSVTLKNPIMPASGCFSTDLAQVIDLNRLGALVAKTETAFEIVKVGFEQFVANTARQNGFAYGLATVALALMTGWMASIVFRKD